jgi:predicted AlkP superfamily pyrophosphatase or phosphodiesterase
MKTYLILSIFLSSLITNAALYDQYKKRPKLIVLIVVDQLRADTFTRFEKKLKPKGSAELPGGYQYLLSNGAYYPLAEYKLMQAMTCPGHAIISTGGYPSTIGIPLNQWYDSANSRVMGCVEDPKFKVSPFRLKTSTIGDELKVISPESKIVAMAMKDRSAVMLGGHKADHAFWFKDKGWLTSEYYYKELPSWVTSENKKIFEGDLKNKSKIEIEDAQNTPSAVGWTTSLAIEAMKAEKLGLDKATDILAISYSSHDMAGHRYGSFSKEVEALTLAEDQEISKLLIAIKKQMGSLNEVVVVLTGDHGIPQTVEQATGNKLDAGRIDSLAFYKTVSESLNQKFGKPEAEWIKAGVSFNYYINPEAVKQRKISVQQAAEVVKIEAKKMKGVYDAFTGDDFKNNLVIHPFLKTGILNQYIPGQSGDVVVLLEPFYMNDGENVVNHLTAYSYDKFVPFVIMGPQFKAGVRSEAMEVIDIAPTLSFILGQLPPAKSSGRVLTEALK